MTEPEPVLAPDLDAIVERNADDFELLRGARLFVTGGTGFVGSWLLESFAWANRRLALDASAVVLTRHPGAFGGAAPHLLADPAISLRRGDLGDAGALWGTFDAIIHAATATAAGPSGLTPQTIIETTVDGTRRVLDLARRNGSIPFLFTSSGAVYGRAPASLERFEERCLAAPDPLQPRFAYHEAKRLAELLCAADVERAGLQAKIARLFAFVGPYLPLERNFAIGNFIADVLAGRTIEVSGDGTAVRSYLYAADLATWLWRILARGKPARAYNVGSERPYSIAEVAGIVAAAGQASSEVTVRAVPAPASQLERYVPDTQRARTELGLGETVSLEAGIRRTIDWHRARRTG
ncbi:MAG: NAD-dependent epimerase/dehydratase family protein [Candidatus Baltobacteraceae bacterium]|jgi:dTDP-glucose 4,6-dehydratase